MLFKAMAVGALVKLVDGLGIFHSSNDFQVIVGRVKESFVKLGLSANSEKIMGGGITTISAPAATPAYIGVGYIIGPELGALNFAGGVLAWGLFVPLMVFFLGPQLIDTYLAANNGDSVKAWASVTDHLYRYIVRPIAVGGMLVGACYTLWKMRKNLIIGIKRGIADVKKSANVKAATERTEKDISFKAVILGIIVVFALMIGLYFYFTNMLIGAILAAVVMLIAGFFFAAVSGNLVGMIGSSNNPISGLTLATTVVAALTMVIIGVTGIQGVAAVLGVAAVVCVSSAVAGEMLQDLKVGHILGGTPSKMQTGDIIGVILAGLVMFFPLYVLHNSDLASNPLSGGFGGPKLPAPQAGLMAALSQGIVGGEMAWPLVLVGIAMGISLILIRVKSPMLFSVGMYLPLETTFAIFIGGLIRGLAPIDNCFADSARPDSRVQHVLRSSDGQLWRFCRRANLASSLCRNKAPISAVNDLFDCLAQLFYREYAIWAAVRFYRSLVRLGCHASRFDRDFSVPGPFDRLLVTYVPPITRPRFDLMP